MGEGSDRIEYQAPKRWDASWPMRRADFVCLANSHGEPFYLNPAGQRLVGLDEDQPASSISLRDLYAEESWTELRDVAVPAVNKTGHWEGRSRLRNAADRRASRRRHQPVSAEVERGRPAHLPGVSPSPQPTDRQPCCAALAEAQARKRAILESSLDPIITIDHAGRHHGVQQGGRADVRPSAGEGARHEAVGCALSAPPPAPASRTASTATSTSARARCWAGASRSTAVRANGDTLRRRNGHDDQPRARRARC